MTDLHQKLSKLQGLLPSQRKWLDRLVFQLDFNPYQFICLVGGTGSGKTTMALAIADLLSDEYNLALLTAEPTLRAPQIRQHLLEQWFGYGVASDKSLLELCADRPSSQSLAVIIDQSEHLPKDLWSELDELPCLVIATAFEPDSHAELNLPLSPLTMEDAEVLLQDQQFSTLTIAERLELASGNIHVLLDPKQARQPSRQTSHQTTPSLAAPLWTFTIGMAAILAVVVFWFWTERQLNADQGLGQLTYLPEELEVAATLPSAAVAVQQQAKKQVVEQLVGQLEQVQANKADVATLERPADFDTPVTQSNNPATTAAATETLAAATAASPIESATIAATEPDLPPTAQQNVATVHQANDVETASSTALNAQADRPSAATDAQQPDEALLAELAAEQVVPTTATAPQLSDEDELAIQAAAERSAETAASRVVDTASELAATTRISETVATTPNPARRLSFDSAALLALPANQYALQLVVFSNPAALNTFRQSYPQLQTLVYERIKDGKRQLVVVMAPFDSAASAKAKTRQLPVPLQQGFAKSLADIHVDINAN